MRWGGTVDDDLKALLTAKRLWLLNLSKWETCMLSSWTVPLTLSAQTCLLSVYAWCYINKQPMYRHNIVIDDTNGKVMICGELKNSSSGTMECKTTDDLKTYGQPHINTNNKKKTWITTECTSRLCWSPITHYPVSTIHVWGLSYKLHNAAPSRSSQRSTEGRGSCSPFFFTGTVRRGRCRFNHMWGKSPPLLFSFSL